MPHILVAGKIHQAGRALLGAAPGVTVDFVDTVSLESYAPLIERADAVLLRTQPMPAEVIDRAPKLKIVSRHGVGYDAVDVEALNRRGVLLTIVGDVNAVAVAEHTLMMMLALAKRATRHDAATRAGDWGLRNTFSATELAGKTLLLIGFGRIGRRVARLAAAFDMQVSAHDPFLSDAAILTGGAKPARDLAAALAEADYISIHAPPHAREALIRAPELARMKPGAILVNTSRGDLVDEAALATALERGALRAAGLDVFAGEPPSPGKALLASEATLLSPHIAGLTEECAARMAVSAARNILDFFAGGLDPALVVNRDRLPGYTAAARPRA